MAGSYDGTVRINTKIDSAGFNSGMKQITNGLSGVLKTIAGIGKMLLKVFSVAAIALFGASLMAIIQSVRSSMGTLFERAGLTPQIDEIVARFEELKLSVANAFLPLVTAALPYVKLIIDSLTAFMNRVSMVTAALMGQKQALQIISGTAKSMAKNTKDAAKGALAAFDQINLLQEKQGQDVTTTDTVGTQMTPIPDNILQDVQGFLGGLKELFAPALESFDRLKKALEPLAQTIWEGLQWGWENVLKPLGEWVISDVVPVFLDALANGAELLNAVLIALKPFAEWLWENFLKPIAGWTGDFIVLGLQNVADVLKIISQILKGDFAGAWATFNEMGLRNSKFFLETWDKLRNWLGTTLAPAVREIFSTLWKNITEIWGAVSSWFREHVGEPIKGAFASAFSGAQDLIRGIINQIIGYIEKMVGSIVTGINTVISTANAVGGLIPGMTVNIPLAAAPSMPRLATGAVIPPNAQFAAILGDQRSGRNLEAPEGLIRQIIREELGNIKADIEIEFTGSLAALARELNPHIKRENVRIGGSLVTSTGSAA